MSVRESSLLLPITALVVGSLFFATAHAYDAPDEPLSLSKDRFTSQYVSVLIGSSAETRSTSFVCSGFGLNINGKHFLVTAKHCADDGNALRYWSWGTYWGKPSNYTSYTVETNSDPSLQFDPYFARDVLITEVAEKDLPSQIYLFDSIRNTPLEPGEDLYVDGYGGNDGPTRMKCNYNGLLMRPAASHPINQDNAEEVLLYKDLSLYGSLGCRKISGGGSEITGFSGGPVFDSEHRLVGVLTDTLSKNDNRLTMYYNSQVQFAPLVANNVSSFAREFCNSAKPGLKIADLCQKDSPIFVPPSPIVQGAPYQQKAQFESLGIPKNTMLPTFSYCRRADLSTVRLMSAGTEIILAIADAARGGRIQKAEWGGSHSNFESDFDTAKVKKFSTLGAAQREFDKECSR